LVVPKINGEETKKCKLIAPKCIWKEGLPSITFLFIFFPSIDSCLAVCIPTIRAHSEAIIVETEKPVDIEAACKALEEAPGVKLVDDIANLKYPMPLTATGAYDMEVGCLHKFLILRLWLGVLCIRRSAFEVMYVGGGSHVSLLY
jgi:Semialdehyde dehydrogenase, dimerisation domain